ncbi:ABC transporter permease [Vagococcus jeotgali]|uniref:ABC transporter permease n=1 Tax=Vagococcus jeotgali TaxID=3109030 RepID=UPI002DD888BE|nr:ABC transporter permease [Vagococcus sp. B2T-5]
MNKFWVVALETYKKNVKSLSFVMMVLAPFVLILFSIGSGYISTKLDPVNEIAIVSQEKTLREAVILTAQQEFDINKSIDSVDEAKVAMEAEEIDGYLEVSVADHQLKGEYTGFETLGVDKEQQLFEALNGIQLALNTKKLGLSEGQVAELLSHPELSENQVSLKNGVLVKSENDRKALILVGFFIVLAMYMIVLLYASITAQEVASEKGTRIMEVILSSTTAAKHFYGKIMGIFLVILTQVLIYLLSGIVGYILAKDMPMVKSFLANVSMGELVRGILGYNLLYLLFGVLIYTILSAFTGSLVSKSEDAAKAVTPVTYLIMIASLPTMLLGLSSPNNILIRVFSYVPFFSSFSMPIRIANGNVTIPEILISLGLLVLASVLLLKFSAKVYKSTVLIYSDKSMMQVFKGVYNKSC